MPIQKDRQKSHMSISWRRSQGAFTCNHSLMPHFSMIVRRNLTSRLTANIQQQNSSMAVSSYTSNEKLKALLNEPSPITSMIFMSSIGLNSG